MKPGKKVLGYVLTFAVFMIIDILWIGFVGAGLYEKYLGGLLSEEVNWVAAIIFYLLYIMGISVFAIYPAVSKGSIRHALAMGAFYGLITYGTYDLTNLATLANWSITITIIDMVWGTVLCTVVSAAGFKIVHWLK